ncbi:MAG: YraN family protein [Muribaculum sp.]|nr:YraN family protein [Muribaculaceae bacterium]MCM1080844.1 YraN family protein [Muribaculum sp.]
MKTTQIGALGEDIACKYLISKGYAIRDQNVRIGHLEIDIIAMLGNRIVFVEVKARAKSSPQHPLDAVTPRKIQRLCTAANAYMKAYNLSHEAQFDIIAIIFSPDGTHTVEHIPDAFFPPLRSYR